MAIFNSFLLVHQAGYTVVPTKVPMTHVYVWAAAKALAAPAVDAHQEPGDSNGIQGAVVA